MTWMVKRKRILPSCLGPGVMLPSCRFRGGQRPTVPETCSACAHTGSQSTDTSTTTRYHKQNTHTRTYFDVSRCWHIASRRWAEFPARLCLYLSFTTICYELISLMRLRVQTTVQWVPSSVSPESSVCCCYWTDSSYRDFLSASAFLFEMFKVFKSQVRCVFSVIHFCVYVFLATQTSVFTPAYGSVTNVRVNSSMMTGQVLNLLLHKFRVSHNTRCHTWTWNKK